MNDPRERLSRLLKEPIEPYDQDWEWVVSDCERVWDYIKLYQKPFLNNYERNLLMEMMLQAVNDIKVEHGFMPRFWHRVKFLLKNNFHIHKTTIEYWGNIGREFTPAYYSWSIQKEIRRLYWSQAANKVIYRTPFPSLGFCAE